MLRCGYSFVDGTDGSGRLDAGLFFMDQPAEPGDRFRAGAAELGRDALNRFIQHTSSAVFACPPGAAMPTTGGTGRSSKT